MDLYRRMIVGLLTVIIGGLFANYPGGWIAGGIVIMVVFTLVLGISALNQEYTRRSLPYNLDEINYSLADYRAMLADIEDATVGEGIMAAGEGLEIKAKIGDLIRKRNLLVKSVQYINDGKRLTWFTRPVDMSTSETWESSQP